MGRLLHVFLLLGGMASLAACGGAGGTTGSGTGGNGSADDEAASGDQTPEVPEVEVPTATRAPDPSLDIFASLGPNDTLTLSGQAVIADIEAEGTNFEERFDIRNAAFEDVEIDFVFRDGALVALVGDGRSFVFEFDERNGDFIFKEDGSFGTANLDGALGIGTPIAGGFEYLTLGIWVQNVGTPDGNTDQRWARVRVGVPTSAEDLPRGTVAEYVGAASGVSNVGGRYFETVASFSARTDFETVNIEATDTIKATADGTSPAPDHDFSGRLAVTGSGFSGSVESDIGGGTTTGQFFGPRALEMGGVFSISGAQGEYLGAYGARR